MMHKKNLVAAIRVNGKVLRESNDRVQLPFGSEYSILLKNLDTVRQQIQIQIDGKETSSWLVLNPGEKLNLERFPRNNLSEGNRFKFIERTQAVENHRGIAAEDGLIRIEFKREIVDPPPVQSWTIINNSYPLSINNSGMRSSIGASSVTDMWKHGNSYAYSFTPNSCFDPTGGIIQANASRGGACGQSVNSTMGLQNQNSQTMSYAGQISADDAVDKAFTFLQMPQATNVSNMMAAQAITFDKSLTPNLNDTGITVDGSVSDQQFMPVQGFDTEAPEVLVLHLIGRHGDVPVQVARMARIKVVCQTCGQKNRSLVKFCSQCGTNLQQV
jgi:hypothetical protein